MLYNLFSAQIHAPLVLLDETIQDALLHSHRNFPHLGNSHWMEGHGTQARRFDAGVNTPVAENISSGEHSGIDDGPVTDWTFTVVRRIH